MTSRLSSYLPFKEPRRRKLVGKQKRQYEDMKTPMKEGKTNQTEKEQFLKEFRIRKKKQRILFILILVAMGLLGLTLMFVVKVK